MKTPLLRRLRLVSGVVLFAYVVGHLANLSLGLVSLQTMEAARPAFMWLWQNPVGLALLYGSMVLHMVLGLLALYQRGTLRMSSSDSLQLVLALALPPLMILHLLGTRAASTIAEFQPTYPWLMLIYWKWVPASGLRQVLVVMAAWIHGCMGMYYWMHVQGWWPRWRGLLYPFAFLVPVAALLGFVEAGKETLALAEDESFMGSVFASVGELSEQTIATLVQTENRLIAMYMTILALVLVARAVRLRVGSGARTVQITYLDGPTVTAPVGLSLLEISHSQDVSHISMCGGKARCGTCRVRVVEGGEHLSSANPLEANTLGKMQAGSDVRLACQAIPQVLRPGAALVIERLVPLDAEIESPDPDPGPDETDLGEPASVQG